MAPINSNGTPPSSKHRPIALSHLGVRSEGSPGGARTMMANDSAIQGMILHAWSRSLDITSMKLTFILVSDINTAQGTTVRRQLASSTASSALTSQSTHWARPTPHEVVRDLVSLSPLEWSLLPGSLTTPALVLLAPPSAEDVAKLHDARLDENIAKLPRELQDLILHETLAASIPAKQYLHWIDSHQMYITSPALQTEYGTTDCTTTLYRNQMGERFDTGEDWKTATVFPPDPRDHYLPGVMRRLPPGEDTIMLYNFTSNNKLRTDSIIPMDPDFKFPLAVQINSKTRAFWEAVFYQGTSFWIREHGVRAFERWILTLDDAQRKKFNFLLPEARHLISTHPVD